MLVCGAGLGEILHLKTQLVICAVMGGSHFVVFVGLQTHVTRGLTSTRRYTPALTITVVTTPVRLGFCLRGMHARVVIVQTILTLIDNDQYLSIRVNYFDNHQYLLLMSFG